MECDHIQTSLNNTKYHWISPNKWYLVLLTNNTKYIEISSKLSLTKCQKLHLQPREVGDCWELDLAGEARDGWFQDGQFLKKVMDLEREDCIPSH
jgi:hypothetical protein